MTDRPVEPETEAPIDDALMRMLAELEQLGSTAIPDEITDHYVTALATVARIADADQLHTRAVDERNKRSVNETMRIFKKKLVARAAGLSLTLLLAGGGVAAAATGTLPEPVQDAVANVAAPLFNLPGGEATPEEKQAAAEDFQVAVDDALSGYLAAMDEWTTCVNDAAAAFILEQGDAENRQSEPVAINDACGDKPSLSLPIPADYDVTKLDDQSLVQAAEEAKRAAEAAAREAEQAAEQVKRDAEHTAEEAKRDAEQAEEEAKRAEEAAAREAEQAAEEEKRAEEAAAREAEQAAEEEKRAEEEAAREAEQAAEEEKRAEEEAAREAEQAAEEEKRDAEQAAEQEKRDAERAANGDESP